MNFKKFSTSDNQWHDVPYYQHKTATDTLTLPAVIYPNDTSITLGIKGNTVQSGTPTPANPVDVVGVGTLDSGQYKIPISSGGVTTPVYLGEVQSTRRIKKLVFDGMENWTYTTSGGKKRVFVRGFDEAQIALALCSHFDNIDFVSYPDSGKFAVNTSSTIQTIIFGITDISISSATDWSTYLAQQYANGTPVCVWYVLATPQTVVVNEPLMKVGDYTDSLTTSIPCTAGENTLDVQTTVQPSEVSAGFSGWHPVQSVHERVNGQWD